MLGNKSDHKLCTFRIEFDPQFEENSIVSIVKIGELQPSYLSWIWSLYYAKVLFVISNDPLAHHLIANIEKWAEAVAPNLMMSLETLDEMGLLVLDESLELTTRSLNLSDKDMYHLEIYQKEGHWPFIQTRFSEQAYQNRLAYSVIALLQHFLNKYPELIRELPIAVLSMRKYYDEKKSYDNVDSTVEAPIYAMQELKDFSEDINRDLDNIDDLDF